MLISRAVGGLSARLDWTLPHLMIATKQGLELKLIQEVSFTHVMVEIGRELGGLRSPVLNRLIESSLGGLIHP